MLFSPDLTISKTGKTGPHCPDSWYIYASVIFSLGTHAWQDYIFSTSISCLARSYK